jgi:hypothetical protein
MCGATAVTLVGDGFAEGSTAVGGRVCVHDESANAATIQQYTFRLMTGTRTKAPFGCIPPAGSLGRRASPRRGHSECQPFTFRDGSASASGAMSALRGRLIGTTSCRFSRR